MIKKTALVLTVMLTLSATLMTSGCLIAAVGAAGGVIYAKGDLESTLEGSPAEVVTAAEKAFAELKIAKISAVSSELEAEVLGRTTTDKKITIISKAKGEKFSSISIRVGTIGDKDISQTILQKIKNNL